MAGNGSDMAVPADDTRLCAAVDALDIIETAVLIQWIEQITKNAEVLGRPGLATFAIELMALMSDAHRRNGGQR